MNKRLQDLFEKGEELEKNRKELAETLKNFIPSSGDWITMKKY